MTRRYPFLLAGAVLALALPFAGIAAERTVPAVQPTLEAIDSARANSDLLILRAGIFDPVNEALDAQGIGAGEATGSDHALVQFTPGEAGARRLLAAQGVEFLGYVPNNAYQVRLNGFPLARIQAMPGVRWAGNWAPAFKLDPALWSASRLGSAARQHDGGYELQIDLFAGTAASLVATALEKSVPGVEIVGYSRRAGAAQYVHVRGSAANLDALIAAATSLDGVDFVSPWFQPELENSGGIGAIQGNATGSCAGSGSVCGPTPLWDQGIFGTGQMVAIADSGLDANEAWFTTLDQGLGPHVEITFADDPSAELPAIGTLHPDNKIVGYWVQPGATAYDNNKVCPGGSSPTSWHGTHVSGTVAGDAAGTFGTSTYTASTPTAANHDLADGMAPNAQILMQDVGNDTSGCLSISDLRGTLEQAFAAGARIHSNSWGGGTLGAYGGNDNNVDYITRRNEDLLVVVSAGNSGSGAQTTTSPANAKNALTVGALAHAGSTSVASYSSRGPTRDGRTKPDIMAPGSSVVSAAGDNSTTGTIEAPISKGLSGTSMAAPTISGNAALVRQYFADGFYPRGTRTVADAYHPSGMAMKAFLLNGTNPLQPTNWPNNNIGWGRAWLDGNLWFASTQPGGDDSRRSRLFERTNQAGLEAGDVHEYILANVKAGAELRATLTWFDLEAAVAAASTLVNNLDLEVLAPGGTYLGNVFANGVSATGGSADAKNTVEQVRLTAPVAGAYTFRVKGTAIPGNGSEGSERQGYALVVSGDFGLPDLAPLPAPTGLHAASNGTGGVGIGFTAAAGAQGFQLYRATGSCGSVDPGDFRMVATGPAAPLVDDRTQGGFTYAYKVRGISNDVEGEASDCFELVSEDLCTLQPLFDTGSPTANGAAASCRVLLAWAGAQTSCPASTGVRYTVERATDPYLGDLATIASSVPRPQYLDIGLTDGQPYYYRVLAADSFGNLAPVSQVVNVTPSGPDGPDPATFLDDVDTHSYMSMESPWQITNTDAASGSFSYRNTADGQPYPNLTCASITTPALTLVPDSTLSFQARYDLEFEWDGVVLEISTDGGATWNDLPPDGGYPGSYAETMNPPINACGYPTTQGSFTGVSTAADNANPNNGSATAVFKPFTVDLGAWAGETVQIRWRMSTDPAAGYLGFLLDEVRIGDGSTAVTDRIFMNGFEDPAGTPGYVCQ